jgi:hypothetical protein
VLGVLRSESCFARLEMLKNRAAYPEAKPSHLQLGLARNPGLNFYTSGTSTLPKINKKPYLAINLKFTTAKVIGFCVPKGRFNN